MVTVDIWCYIAGNDKQQQCFRIRARPTDTVYDLKKRIVQERAVKAITETAQIHLYKCPFPGEAKAHKTAKKQQRGANASGTAADLHDRPDIDARLRPLSNQQLTSEVLPELFRLEWTWSPRQWVPLRVRIHDKWAPQATFRLHDSKVGVVASIQHSSLRDLRELLRARLTGSGEGAGHEATEADHVRILNQQHGQITSLDQLRESQVYTVVIGEEAWRRFGKSTATDDEKQAHAELARQIARVERLSNVADKLIGQLIEASNALKRRSPGEDDAADRDTGGSQDASETVATSMHPTIGDAILVPDSLREPDVGSDGEGGADAQHSAKRARVARICSTPPKRIRSNSINQLLTRQAIEEARQATAVTTDANHQHATTLRRPRSRYNQVNLSDVFGHNAASRQRETSHAIAVPADKQAMEKATDSDDISKHVLDEHDNDGNLSDTVDIPTPPGMREFLEMRDAQLEQTRRKGLIPLSDLKFPVNAPGYEEVQAVEQRQLKLSKMYFKGKH
ncbi:hypothetical protein SYNPS1DRAFT_29998 [Syncephalis pseudoplumigaleata]|uniref:Crinkler effector protein N-terminal domain-containing protein n=1 Tax=Syncephalis pseudoplumigaleata TaxID=1712513 RepID=A0A4P9YW50_9FUNG|nr:hypothetical protein SYNPS1DRAFT_29998 [Syncephalis pseudoplumigaleata]|eukprot:RKP24237.1 hypothetical protein SYNPS1DRAFT_29998 [Syncephalis pseudoplumigaleata]